VVSICNSVSILQFFLIVDVQTQFTSIESTVWFCIFLTLVSWFLPEFGLNNRI
jgi:hypothetical protein